MAEKLQCSAKVWHGWHHYQCSRPVTASRNGTLWCKQHDPERVAAKETQQRKETEKLEQLLRQLHDRALKQCMKLGEGIPNGSSWDKKRATTGILLTFEQADRLIAQLQARVK